MSDLIESEILGISKITNTYAISFNWNSEKKVKQWMACITGICPTYGFQREFVNSRKKDVLDVQQLRSFLWEYSPGKIYQYAGFMVDYVHHHLASGYFISYPNGIVPIEQDQVRIFLNMPVKDKENVKRFTLIPGDNVPDDIPF